MKPRSSFLSQLRLPRDPPAVGAGVRKGLGASGCQKPQGALSPLASNSMCWPLCRHSPLHWEAGLVPAHRGSIPNGGEINVGKWLPYGRGVSGCTGQQGSREAHPRKEGDDYGSERQMGEGLMLQAKNAG